MPVLDFLIIELSRYQPIMIVKKDMLNGGYVFLLKTIYKYMLFLKYVTILDKAYIAFKLMDNILVVMFLPGFQQGQAA